MSLPSGFSSLTPSSHRLCRLQVALVTSIRQTCQVEPHGGQMSRRLKWGSLTPCVSTHPSPSVCTSSLKSSNFIFLSSPEQKLYSARHPHLACSQPVHENERAVTALRTSSPEVCISEALPATSRHEKCKGGGRGERAGHDVWTMLRMRMHPL